MRCLSAEDKTFWTHGGVDYTGLAGAVLDYVSKIGSDARAKGGSTITQQVAKNILIGNEYSIGRKFKEMVLAGRIEDVLSKQQILELYLNEIPLGRQSFGVQAASRAYFDKDVGELAAARGGLPRHPAQGARDLWPRQECRRGGRAAQLGARPDGQERLGDGRTGRRPPRRSRSASFRGGRRPTIRRSAISSRKCAAA